MRVGTLPSWEETISGLAPSEKPKKELFEKALEKAVNLVESVSGSWIRERSLSETLTLSYGARRLGNFPIHSCLLEKASPDFYSVDEEKGLIITELEKDNYTVNYKVGYKAGDIPGLLTQSTVQALRYLLTGNLSYWEGVPEMIESVRIARCTVEKRREEDEALY